ncbi:MAG: nucleotide exchange factor GrpE [Patescibacteria group bacterium]|nr:nucleotide exchange factor GrpE [Patescibacteria group bacterium]
MIDDQAQNDLDEEITLDKLQEDLDSAMNGWKRTAADFENFKKRAEAEKKELLEFAKEVTVVKLLPTIDTLEQALRHLPVFSQQATGNSEQDFAKQYQNWQTGVNGIVKQLDKVLEELGVKKIHAIGKKFDPNFHEAVKEVMSDEDDGMVIDELQSGFELNGKVIRPSQVVISKKN